MTYSFGLQCVCVCVCVRLCECAYGVWLEFFQVYLDGLLLLTLPGYQQVPVLSYAPRCHLHQRLLQSTVKHTSLV